MKIQLTLEIKGNGYLKKAFNRLPVITWPMIKTFRTGESKGFVRTAFAGFVSDVDFMTQFLVRELL